MTAASRRAPRTRSTAQPAIAFFERYLGPAASPPPPTRSPVFAGDSEDFYLRAPVGIDEATGSRSRWAAPSSELTTVQLTVAVTDEIFEGTQSAVAKAIKGYPGLKPDAALIFSCAIRKYVLGSRTGTEIEIARRELGAGLPVCGFYSFGEIAPDDSGTSRFHNETMVAVVLGTE